LKIRQPHGSGRHLTEQAQQLVHMAADVDGSVRKLKELLYRYDSVIL
jgi:hypothetical protein